MGEVSPNELSPKDNSPDITLKNDSAFQKITNVFEKIVVSFNNVLHKISSVLLFLMMVLTALDVAGRFFFNKPITGTYEITGLTLALIVFFSLGSAQLKKDHIEIDFLTSKLPVKVQAGMTAVSSFILFVLMSLTTWQLFEYTKRTWLSQELSGDLGLPLYVFMGLTLIGALAFTLTYLLETFKSLLQVVNKG
ncbi:TRAP transporter small permease [Lysinibacillus sp. BW-2-10]|uniref:TRAP transporter small permease n=1 Tax=Lysinibacillus sp. BW-2-10 TaxID=2590030 RepID=UPI0021020944|nr:TRAP transporter small permease [Lysinibacillus sp. BW-2-10]